MENRIFRDQINNHFNRDELIILCYDLEIDPEAFPENISKPRMVQEIISFCQRHGKTDELLIQCQMSRPKINWSLEQLASGERGKSEPKSATHILESIVPAGPIQPDGGLTHNSINAVKDFINYWNNYGELSLIVRVNSKGLEKSGSYFQMGNQTYLFAEHNMHQVWIGTSDKNNNILGMVQPPTNISENEYYKALEFFLVQMGLLKSHHLKVGVSQIANLENSFIIIIQESE